MTSQLASDAEHDDVGELRSVHRPTLTTHHGGVLLGKAKPKYDGRTAKLARYMDLSVLPTPPDETTRSTDHKVQYSMYRNDTIGICTFAGIGNIERFWAKMGDHAGVLRVSSLLKGYKFVTGEEGGTYDPQTGANDNGCVELDVLRYWNKVGVGGKTIEAYAAINLNNEDLLRAAVWVFDGAYIGLSLPVTAQDQEVWDYEPGAGSQANPGSWGGHCVVIVDYNHVGPVYVTWGMLKQATWAFHAKYTDEQYAIVSLDEQMKGKGKTREGFDAEALSDYLKQVA